VLAAAPAYALPKRLENAIGKEFEILFKNNLLNILKANLKVTFHYEIDYQMPNKIKFRFNMGLLKDLRYKGP